MSLKIICHMISSVDGRLLPARWTEPAQPLDVTEVYETAASSFPADGWLIGRASMAQYDNSISEGDPAPKRAADEPRPQPFVGAREGRMLAIAVDPKGKLRYRSPTLATGEHLVAVLAPDTAESYLAELRRVGVSYVFEGEGDKALQGALDEIEQTFGAKLILLEGGGLINGSFLKAGLIDEFSILVFPGIDGLAGIPSIVGYAGKEGEKPAEGQSLELIEAKTMNGGVVWLRYRVHRKA